MKLVVAVAVGLMIASFLFCVADTDDQYAIVQTERQGW